MTNKLLNSFTCACTERKQGFYTHASQNIFYRPYMVNYSLINTGVQYFPFIICGVGQWIYFQHNSNNNTEPKSAEHSKENYIMRV